MSFLSKDLTDPRWMYLKAALFAVIGVSSVALILAEHPSWKLAGLLALAIWSFARLYYFAFYVIERYIDPRFKFAGLWSVVRYLLSRRKHSKDATRESFPGG
jgi:hypothetical protein